MQSLMDKPLKTLLGWAGIGLILSLVLVGFHFQGGEVTARLDARGNPWGSDFVNVWGAPRIAQAEPSLLTAPEAYNDRLGALYGVAIAPHQWSYPPHSLLFFAPFGQMGYLAALFVWSLLGLGLYLWVASRGLVLPMRGWALAALALAPASLVNLINGQNGFFTAALFLGACLFLPARPVLGGALLGLLTCKPQLGLLWPFWLLWKRAWGAIAVAAGVMLLLIALSAAVYGVAVWEGFFAFTQRLGFSFALQAFDGLPYQHMMLSLPLSLRMAGVGETAALLAQALLSIVVLIAVLRAARRPLPGATLALLLTSGALLVTPYAFNYDMTALSAAIVWRLFDGRQLGRANQMAMMFAYFAPLLIYWITLLSLPFAPLLLLPVFVLTWHEAMHTKQESVS